MSRERPNQKQICFMSMASTTPKYCERENCEAWYSKGEECTLPASANSMSYNMYRLAQFISYLTKKKEVFDLAPPIKKAWKRRDGTRAERRESELPDRGEGDGRSEPEPPSGD